MDQKHSMDQKYQRIKVIGKGSFGKAYLVKNTEEDSLCVVKQMEAGMMDAKDRNEAVKEALYLKKMEHPNIIQFLEVFMTKKGRLCIVMEYADGGDVHDEIKKQDGKLLAEECILSWFVQTCFALLHVHQQRVLHRDLKTQNIFLTKSGQIKLGDFGIARLLEATKDMAQTMVGTPYYLSPEIIQDKPYDYKSDVWSCGVVLFEMAKLQRPFSAECLSSLAVKILKDEIPELDKMYSPELSYVIQRMLKKDASLRPSFRQILTDSYLQLPMRTANEKFTLGLDLSEFAPETRPVELEPRTPLVKGSDEAGGTDRFGNDSFDADSEESESEDTAKSVAALKLTGEAPATSSDASPAGFSAKAAALRRYLKENTADAEFSQVQVLIRDTESASDQDLQKAADALRSQVSELLGSKRAQPLLPMFQLLHFLEGVAVTLREVSAEPGSTAVFKQKQMIVETFRRWDLNADGYIVMDEFRRVLSILGVSDSDITGIFNAADKNADGKIDYTEFVDWLYTGSALSAFGSQVASEK